MSARQIASNWFNRGAPVLAGAALCVLVLLASGAAAAPVRILAFGDSLTAGYGLAAEDAFPTRLEAALKARGHDVVIVNGGVSGDTASGGFARLEWTLAEGADAVIVELGANDALRGVDPAQTRQALERILAALRERDLPVLLAGMAAPRNMGQAYVDAFDPIYPQLAEKYDAVFYPFFLEGVATDVALNQGDGIHPNAAGVEVVVANILPKVEELLARVAPRNAD